MQHNSVVLGDLISTGINLEIGCFKCRLHVYIAAESLTISPKTPLPCIAALLRCPQCHSINKEAGYPLWVRPDARPPRMGANSVQVGL